MAQDTQQQQTVEDLGKLVKAKYPQYAALPDIELGQKVKAKYPQYKQFADVPAGNLPTLPAAPKPGILTNQAEEQAERFKKEHPFLYGAFGNVEPVPSEMAVGPLVKAAGGAGSAALKGLAEGIPDVNPVAKFLIRRIPGGKFGLDALELLKKSKAEEPEKFSVPLPGKAAVKEAPRFEVEAPPKPVQTTAQKFKAKAPPKPKATEPKPRPAMGYKVPRPEQPVASKPTEAAAPGATPDTAPNAEPGAIWAHGNKLMDARKQLFANAQQSGLNNAAFRDTVEKLYGKRISAMTHEEIVRVLQDLHADPAKFGAVK